MTSSRLLLIGAAALTATACGLANDAVMGGKNTSALCAAMGQALNSTGPVPEGCVKIEGGEIGQAPQTLTFSGITVTITGWTDKGDEPGDKVGFTFTTTGKVLYAVKASTQQFVGTSTTWVNPYGTSGSAAHGISNITFCPGEGGDAGTPSSGDDAGSPFDDGNGGGGGECTPDAGTPPGAGVGTPCTTTAQCGADLTCVQGTCKVVIL